ncbi:hypothetical protein QFC21_002196 [Naganishia friedmannii]|uniref:Uncharacterized protein n=1 Tax=Naganishia friedmannii TaxID=89922 RepID=A0ACC2VYL7_9TREE|nr:hypothetical protein QFC21_002196 [Naganishia friedmannii]
MLTSIIRSLGILAVLGLAAANAAENACIPSGRATEVLINERFRIGGPRTTVTLCPGSIHRLQAPIEFTAQGQVLTTQGNVQGWKRAMLLVEGEDQSMAIKADCSNCHSITIRSLIVDGNRPLLLRVPKGEALVEMGNAEAQVIQDCRLLEPREGDWKSCRGGIIKNNVIGPAGEEWDEEYDGSEDPEPRFGNPRADGISLACKDSTVSGNTVFDTTDGAIVLFGSSGSQVNDNLVYARTRMVMGGINMVDYDPWEGDYTGVRVHGNTVSGFGGYIKGAINIGQACWTDNTEIVVHGGEVSGNTIEGEGIGYGITVAGAKGVVVMDNKSTAKYGGVRGRECPKAPENAEPCPFLINRGSSEGVFQDEFVNGEVQHGEHSALEQAKGQHSEADFSSIVICIEPETSDGEPYKPWRLRDSPLAVATFAEEAIQAGMTNGYTDEAMASPNAALAESLVTYQMEIMAALKAVTDKVASVASGKDVKGRATTMDKSPFSAVLTDLFTRLANLESEKKQVRSTIEQMGKTLGRFNTRFSGHQKDHNKALRRVVSAAKRLRNIDTLSTLPSSALALMPHRVRAHNWTPAAAFVLLELFAVAGWAFFHRRTRSAHDLSRGTLTGGRSLGFSSSKPPATLGLFGRKNAVKMV